MGKEINSPPTSNTSQQLSLTFVSLWPLCYAWVTLLVFLHLGSYKNKSCVKEILFLTSLIIAYSKNSPKIWVSPWNAFLSFNKFFLSRTWCIRGPIKLIKAYQFMFRCLIDMNEVSTVMSIKYYELLLRFYGWKKGNIIVWNGLSIWFFLYLYLKTMSNKLHMSEQYKYFWIDEQFGKLLRWFSNALNDC